MTIEILPNSRTFIVGMTGTGKTYLALHILKNAPRLVVFDTKGNLRKRMDLTKGTGKAWSRLMRGLPVRLQVEDVPEHTDRTQYFDDYCKRIISAGNCRVYVDEMLDVIGTTGVDPSYHFRALFSKGREKLEYDDGRFKGGYIGVVACTQRPSRIPVLTMTEADNLFCFALQYPEDRQKVAGFMGMRDLPPIEDEHGFYYFKRGMKEPEYYSELDAE